MESIVFAARSDDADRASLVDVVVGHVTDTDRHLRRRNGVAGDGVQL